MNIILCGLPMSGKTTVGKSLAAHLNWAFIDTDERIEWAYEKEYGSSLSCRQIYRKEGEAFFRHFESQQIKALQHVQQSVIASGGGTLHTQENSEILRTQGHFVYLDVPLENLWERAQAKGIPAFLDTANPKQTFYQLATRRLSLYESCAYLTIDVQQLSVEEIVAKILNHKELKYG